MSTLAALTWRPPSTVSHELLNGKHKSSLAGIARTSASGQQRPRAFRLRPRVVRAAAVAPIAESRAGARVCRTPVVPMHARLRSASNLARRWAAKPRSRSSLGLALAVDPGGLDRAPVFVDFASCVLASIDRVGEVVPCATERASRPRRVRSQPKLVHTPSARLCLRDLCFAERGCRDRCPPHLRGVAAAWVIRCVNGPQRGAPAG